MEANDLERFKVALQSLAFLNNLENYCYDCPNRASCCGRELGERWCPNHG